MKKDIGLSDLEFQLIRTSREIAMLCCCCGQESALDGGYVAGVRIYRCEPAHLFFVCGRGCLVTLLMPHNRAVVDRFISSEVRFTRRIYSYNKSKRQ